jgi:hypothetical protein
MFTPVFKALVDGEDGSESQIVCKNIFSDMDMCGGTFGRLHCNFSESNMS